MLGEDVLPKAVSETHLTPDYYMQVKSDREDYASTLKHMISSRKH